MGIAFTFPGQGSQAVGMGKDLADNFAEARAVFQEVDDALGQKLSDIMWNGPEETLTLTANAQPALMAVSLAVIRTLGIDQDRLNLDGGAIALGGHDLQRHGWAWTIKDRDGESIRFERIKGGGTDDLGPFTTRTLAWTGGEALTVESSINVEYVQGPANTVVVTGPKGLTDRVTLTDGRLSLGDGDERIVFGWSSGNFSARSERDELRVVVTAPSAAAWMNVSMNSLPSRNSRFPSGV